MTLRLAALGAVLLCAGMSLSQTKTYRVAEGDTLSEIAARFQVNPAAIRQANGLGNTDLVRIGRTLRIPAPLLSTASSPAVLVSQPVGRTHRVRLGEHDWSISRRYGLTMAQLHAANPGIDWRRLQPNTVLRIPVAGVPAQSMTAARGAQIASLGKGAVVGQPVRPAQQRLYKVRPGDNDWVIARRYGIAPSQLRAANPNVDWARLPLGTQLRIPTAGAPSARLASAAAAPANRIRTRYAAINNDNVNVRRYPSTSSELLVRVDSGVGVRVLDREGEWYKLRFPRGTEGWVRGEFLRASSTLASAREVRREREARRNVASARVAQRSERSERRTTRRNPIVREERATRVASRLPGASAGLMDNAFAMRGVRYRWGGMSRSGVDCSGFTSKVFRSQGVRLPRTSRQQATVGQRVSKGELKKGDLVFFRTGRGNRISHVGIYSGNGKFIHASSGGGRVQVNSLSEGYYQRRFVTARRVAKVSSSSSKSNRPAAQPAENWSAAPTPAASPQAASAPASAPPASPPPATPPANG